MTADVGTPTYSTDAQGRQTLTCDATLRATATGNGRGFWMGAVLTFYAVNKPSTPLDSSAIPDSTIRASWGGGLFDRDSVMRARWTFYASFPFTVAARFRYQVVGGREDSTGVRFACKPAVAPGPPPVVSVLAALPTNVYEPSRVVGVTYTASSQVGLWEDIISVAGPCDTLLYIPDSLRSTVSRTVRWLLPGSCGLGVPLQVTVNAFDAELQATQRTITLPALVDTTPPTIYVRMPTPYTLNGRDANVLGGDIFAGDSVYLFVQAWDNHVLRSVNWGFAPQGAADSLVVTGTFGDWMKLPVSSTWSGPTQLSIFARDASGNTSVMITSPPDSMHIIPSVSPPTTVSPVPPFGGVLWDLRRGMLYLNEGVWSKRIGVFSRAAKTLTSTVFLDDYPVAIDLSPGGDSMVVALAPSRSLAIVNLQSLTPTVTTVPLPGIDSTMTLVSLVVAANGKALIAANNYGAGTGHIYTYDLSTATLSLRSDAGNAGQTGSGRLAGSYDRSAVVLNGGAGEFQRYDAASDAFGPATTARMTDVAPQVDGSGASVTVGGDLYDFALRYTRTPRAVFNRYQPMALSPDGKTIVFAYARFGAVRSLISDGSTIDHLALPLTVNGMSLSPDGTAMAIMEEDSHGNYFLGVADLTQLPAASRAAPAGRASR